MVPKITRKPAADREAFVRRLKRCETLAGSQSALAFNAGIPQSTIRRYTARSTEPPRDVLIKLARAAGVSILWLATGDGPEATQGGGAPAGGVKSSDGTEEIAAITAKLYAVPLEFARSRLSGSDEIKRLRQAMAEWSRFQPLRIVTPISAPIDWPSCCILLKDDLKRTCPDTPPESLAAYRVNTDLMAPNFAVGDWALVKTDNPIGTGTYCVIKRESQLVEVRDITVHSMVEVSASKDRAGDTSATTFVNLDQMQKAFTVIGRFVGAIRVIPLAHQRTR